MEKNEWIDAGFDLEEAKEWIEAGFNNPEEVEKWIDEGFDNPKKAERWHDKFDDPKIARHWHDYGWEDPDDAFTWYDYGWDPDEAIEWYEAGWDRYHSESAADYAKTYRELGFTPLESLKLHKLGIFPIDKSLLLKKYIESGIFKLSFESNTNLKTSVINMLSWIDKIEKGELTLDEAEKWITKGVENPNDVNKSENKEEQTFTPEEARRWHDAGFTPEEAVKWKNAGWNNPDDAKKWKNVSWKNKPAEDLKNINKLL